MALEKKLQDFDNALSRLMEAHTKTIEYKDSDEFSYYRDSLIQRFEFTLEIAWKSIKEYLLEHEGIECRSPKSCLREFVNIGALDGIDNIELMAMVDDRNLATHTYHESLANEIYERIGNYIFLLQAIHRHLFLNR